MKKNIIASVHGRFQPLHLGHEEYILAALKKCSHLYIGITQIYNNDLKEDAEKNRYKLSNNPLNFFQRLQSIECFIEEYSLKNCTPIPFPIEHPNMLTSFLAKEILCITTIMDDWNIEKIKTLEKLGYKTSTLWDRRGVPREYSGTKIRNLCRKEGIEAIKDCVSQNVYSYLKKINFQEILLDIK